MRKTLLASSLAVILSAHASLFGSYYVGVNLSYENPSYTICVPCAGPTESVYDITDSIQYLLDTIVYRMPGFAAEFPYYYGSYLSAIDMRWQTIGTAWREFIYAYIREHEPSIYDLQEIRETLRTIVEGMDEADPYYCYDTRYTLYSIQCSLDDVLRDMQRPWYGWDSATLTRMADHFEDACDAVLEFSE